jgi:hypothetical protein
MVKMEGRMKVNLMSLSLTMPLAGQLIMVKMEARMKVPITVQGPAPHLNILNKTNLKFLDNSVRI